MRALDVMATLLLIGSVSYVWLKRDVGHDVDAGLGAPGDAPLLTANLADYLELREMEARMILELEGADARLPLSEPPEQVLAAAMRLGVPPHRVALLYHEDITQMPFHLLVKLPLGRSPSLDDFLIQIGLSQAEREAASQMECVQRR